MDEIKRLQQLAGILTEIKVNNPTLNFNNYKTVVGESKIDTEYFSVDYYLELIDLGSYYTFIPHGGIEEVVLIPKEYIAITDKTGDFKLADKGTMDFLKNLISKNKYKII